VLRPIASLAAVLCLASAAPGAARESRDTTATAAELIAAPWMAGPYARISLRYPGVYRVTGRELADAGVPVASVRPRTLSLWNEGRRVPIMVYAANAARLGPDDAVEFVGDFPRGENVTFKPQNLHNVYLLSWSAPDPVQYRTERLTSTPATLSDAAFECSGLLERDFIHRYSPLPPEVTDGFHWMPYQAGGDTQMLRLDFPGFDRRHGDRVSLVIRAIGGSQVTSIKPMHQFDAWYGELPLGTVGFDGMGYHDFETSIPADRIGRNLRFQFKTPENRKDAIDQILLENIRVSYPRTLDALGAEMLWFSNRLLGAPLPQASVEVRGLQPGSAVFAVQQGIVFRPATTTATSVIVSMGDDPTSFVAAAPFARYKPDRIDLGRGASSLTTLLRDTEVLVLAHPDVARAADSYARYRRGQGMEVAVVSATDVYDALNDGFIGDIPLKRFIRHAAQECPSLKYLVLFGDSTYDYREARTGDQERQPRVLIPIHWILNPATTWTGGYPDDNWYASFRSANTPEIAVGRIPARDDQEGMEYLRKVIEYENGGAEKAGKLLLISSVEKSFQELVQEVSTKHGARFTTVSLVFPETNVAEREVQRLKDEMNSGVRMLYYVGHGGALVWRVGPTDFKAQKDLFTPGDIRALSNRGMYPIILASSCYTTSFDGEESLGETFVMEPGKGAIAVIGTPWKATVYDGHNFNKQLIDRHFEPSTRRLGDAFLHAKQAMRPPNDSVVEFQDYTLLGDPCLKVVQ
jgi:hypothetical protein